jgi:hypothetical protein
MTRPAIRAVPALTGGLLGVALGWLILDGICANRPEPDGIEILPFAAALWLFVAGGVFAANEAWRGRSTLERARVFGWCLGIALALLLLPLVLLTIFVMVFEALGGHP